MDKLVEHLGCQAGSSLSVKLLPVSLRPACSAIMLLLALCKSNTSFCHCLPVAVIDCGVLHTWQARAKINSDLKTYPSMIII
jgi:hypothetical protein